MTANPPVSETLKPCPFCGGEAEIERYGNSRQSTIYACTECGCLLETGEEFNHGARWNTRALEAAREALRQIVNLSDSEMRDGDGARDIAARAIGVSSWSPISLIRSLEEISRLIEIYPPTWRRWCDGPECGGCACIGCVRVPAPSTVNRDPEYCDFPNPADRLTKEEVEFYTESKSQ
jgi:hypothetical protein